MVYKSLVCDRPAVSVYTPRNLKQMRNASDKVRSQTRLTHDGLYNVLSMLYGLDGVILYVKHDPGLQIAITSKHTVQEFTNLLYDKDCQVLLSYDTTFNTGDFYVFPLVFRHHIFVEEPVIPLASCVPTTYIC